MQAAACSTGGRRDQPAEEDGALAREVELVGVEHDAGGKSGEDDRDHALEDDPDVAHPREGRDDEVVERLEGHVTDDEDEHHRHRERHEDGRRPADDLEFEAFTHG